MLVVRAVLARGREGMPLTDQSKEPRQQYVRICCTLYASSDVTNSG